MTERTISHQSRKLREAEAEVSARRTRLRGEMRGAQQAGASIAQLMEWTGYSRRTVFYMLKENTK